jgi:hypothetical protein
VRLVEQFDLVAAAGHMLGSYSPINGIRAFSQEEMMPSF